MATVLVVEDERAVQRLIQTTLELDGHNVRVADDAASALKTLSPFPDVIVLDIRLPDTDGLTFLAEALSWGYLGKVLVVSAWNGGREYTRFAGVDAYMHKPFEPEELSQAIDDLLGAGRLRS